MGSQSRGPDTYVYTGVQEGLTAGGHPGFKLDTCKGRSNTGAAPPVCYIAFENHTRFVLALKGLEFIDSGSVHRAGLTQKSG